MQRFRGLTCLLPVFFCTGVAPPSAWEREGVPTDLLPPVCTAGEAQAAGLDAEAPGDAFALPCVATLPVEEPVLESPRVASSCQVSLRMAKHLIRHHTRLDIRLQHVKKLARTHIDRIREHNPHLAAAARRLRNWAGLHAARRDEAVLPKAPVAQDALVACRAGEVVGLHLSKHGHLSRCLATPRQHTHRA